MADDNGSSFLWFLAGLGIGAVVGVLYAPKAGFETREDIMQRANEGRDYVKDRAREAREQAQQWADRGREYYEQQKGQVKSAIDAGKEAYREATAHTSTGTGPES